MALINSGSKFAPQLTTQVGVGGPAHYVATLAVNSGQTYTFDSASAVDQGNYNGGYVQQKSLMVQVANCPFTVFFRPDVNGLRDEVVVELGKVSNTWFTGTDLVAHGAAAGGVITSIVVDTIGTGYIGGQPYYLNFSGGGGGGSGWGHAIPDASGNIGQAQVYLDNAGSGYTGNATITFNNTGRATHIMSGYTLTVSKNGAPLFTQSVPKHWWYARWRWQSAPRPRTAVTIASLIASGALLPHNSTWLYGYTAWTDAKTTALDYIYHFPMSSAGMGGAMGGVGDRPPIGPVTTPQADYIVLGTPAAWTAMINMAEGASTMGFHVRDETTGRWLDNQASPYHSIIYLGGAGQLPFAGTPYTDYVNRANYDADWFVLDLPHMYPLYYTPYLLTDDPYYLEGVQAMGLVHAILSAYWPSIAGLPGLASPGETRAVAWGNRDVACATYVTPGSVPSWIQPKSLWLQNLADNRTYLQRYMDSPALIHSRFRAYSRTDVQGAFQLDYMCIAMCMVARLGFTEWNDGVLWAWGQMMPLVTGTDYTTGWLKGWPIPYYFAGFDDSSPSYSSAPIIGPLPDTTWDFLTLTWAQCFQQYGNDNKTGVSGGQNDSTLVQYPPPWDGDTVFQTLSGGNYMLWRQCALHLGLNLGNIGVNIPGISAAVSWFDRQMAGTMAVFTSTSNDPRYSIDTGYNPTGTPGLPTLTPAQLFQGYSDNTPTFTVTLPAGSQANDALVIQYRLDSSTYYATGFPFINYALTGTDISNGYATVTTTLPLANGNYDFRAQLWRASNHSAWTADVFLQVGLIGMAGVGGRTGAMGMSVDATIVKP
jgi:hypothetical protein